MASVQITGDIESFQKWLPLRVVPLEDLPNTIDYDLLSKSTPQDLAHLGALMQNLCSQLNGVGLSAIQCGIPIPFFVASDNSKDFTYYLDVEYQDIGKSVSSIEGCLSILDQESNMPRRFVVSRSDKVRCKGKKIVFGEEITLQPFSEEFKGLLGNVMQHEADHSRFILISDIGKEIQII